MENRNMNELDSKITSVTVYGDRAQVTRTAVLDLTKGEHLLAFRDLPVDIEQNSIQVSGKGRAVIRDVKFRTEHFAETPRVPYKALQDEKIRLEDKLAEMDDRMSEAEKERAFIDEIEKKLVRPTREARDDELNTDKWQALLGFYRSRLENVSRELRGHGVSKRETTRELEKVNREIQDMGAGGMKQTNLVEVTVDMLEKGELTLHAVYLVYGPSWRPVYDLRVLTEEKKMNISYNALIRQGSGEDWTDVQLKLSTAQAQVGGRQPDLAPWHLSVSAPRRESSMVPASRLAAPSAAGALAKKDMNRQMFAADESLMEQTEMMAPEEPEAEIPETTVETGTTSVVFAVNGSNTIQSDNMDHKATILLSEFPAKFRYSTAPKLSPYAYLKAQVKNTTEYPFLAGQTNIFLDNNFVSNASIDLVAPSEEFWTFLGIDESMKVEHKILKKYHKESLIGRKDTLIYEFLIWITNNKKTEEEIVVWDQVPISNDQNITVKLIEPQFKENTEALKKNEENFLEWFFKLKPGAKLEIPLKFSIEYPRGITIQGL